MQLILLFSFLLNGMGPIEPQAVSTVDHSEWDVLLQRHVDLEGTVDYLGFATDQKALLAYLDRLAQHPIARDADKNERLAYYINLYNAATVQLILDHYPLNSIRDIPKPWGKKFINIGGSARSLGTIEHRILRKMNEPRIHFAINCASRSCPKLWNYAYTADDMEAQLERAARDFINDPERNTVKGDTLALSQIFKWFKKDFSKSAPLLETIDRYTEMPVSKTAVTRYRTYDWSLNDRD